MYAAPTGALGPLGQAAQLHILDHLLSKDSYADASWVGQMGRQSSSPDTQKPVPNRLGGEVVKGWVKGRGLRLRMYSITSFMLY